MKGASPLWPTGEEKWGTTTSRIRLLTRSLSMSQIKVRPLWQLTKSAGVLFVDPIGQLEITIPPPWVPVRAGLFGNLDGGKPDSFYGGVVPVDGGNL